MLNFGNVDTEIPLPNSCCLRKKCVWSAQSEKKKKNCNKLIAAMPLPKQGEKNFVTIVAMTLPKMGGKKSGSEIWGE